MPPITLHMVLAERIADALGNPVLDGARGQYLLGATTPDIRVITRQDRYSTHFFDLGQADRLRIAPRANVERLELKATALAGPGFWWPVAIAAPLVSVQLWFDRRSRSRRLLPELAGAVGITSLVAAITLAGGGDTAVAVGAWAILAARALTSIPFVKSLVMKLHGKATAQWTLITWDVVAVAIVVTAAWLEPTLTAGAVAVVAVVAVQRLTTLRPPPRPTVTGIRQTFMGLAVVVATWLGVLMGGA